MESPARARIKRILTWPGSSSAAILYSLTALQFFGKLEDRGLAGPLGVYGSNLLLSGAIACWMLCEARRADRNVSYDFATYCFMAWPVMVPWLVFSTRGWRGFAVLGWFFVLATVSANLGPLLAPLNFPL
jgi:hypothetical protein